VRRKVYYGLKGRGVFKWKNVFEKIKIMTKLMKASGFDLSFNPVLGKHTVFLCVRKIHSLQVQCVVKYFTIKVCWTCNNFRV
jgi:hypothetical protein